MKAQKKPISLTIWKHKIPISVPLWHRHHRPRLPCQRRHGKPLTGKILLFVPEKIWESPSRENLQTLTLWGERERNRENSGIWGEREREDREKSGISNFGISNLGIWRENEGAVGMCDAFIYKIMYYILQNCHTPWFLFFLFFYPKSNFYPFFFLKGNFLFFIEAFSITKIPRDVT